jgi:hypothetical protein
LTACGPTRSSKKTLEITRQAGALYDKEGFVGDLIKIGKKKE